MYRTDINCEIGRRGVSLVLVLFQIAPNASVLLRDFPWFLNGTVFTHVLWYTVMEGPRILDYVASAGSSQKEGTDVVAID